MNEIIVMENNVIENDPGNVSNIMNEYYVNITISIGNDDSISIDDQFEDIIKTHPRHLSILRIKESIKYDRHFLFSHVNVVNVCKRLSDLNPRKAPGYDAIPPNVLCHPTMWLIIKRIQNSKFPDNLKSAEISPIFI